MLVVLYLVLTVTVLKLAISASNHIFELSANILKSVTMLFRRQFKLHVYLILCHAHRALISTKVTELASYVPEVALFVTVMASVLRIVLINAEIVLQSLATV